MFTRTLLLFTLVCSTLSFADGTQLQCGKSMITLYPPSAVRMCADSEDCPRHFADFSEKEVTWSFRVEMPSGVYPGSSDEKYTLDRYTGNLHSVSCYDVPIDNKRNYCRTHDSHCEAASKKF